MITRWIESVKETFNMYSKGYYPALRLRIISPSFGLLPYIKRKVLTILTVNNMPPTMVKTSTRILVAICQAGTSVEPNLIIKVTGAVRGKMVITIKAGLLGNIMIKDETHNGATALNVNTVASCWPSLADGVTAPIAVEIMANNR